MSKQIKYACLVLVFSFWTGMGIVAQNYSYETYPNDPLKARIYTLDNGLKVYMTVNKEKPRIQTAIAVRVGGKNDPAETTGLAHYFEHLMFKGTASFGTQNYEKEKPLLDQVEQLFEVYRKTSDSLERENIYHVIDSLSYEASKISIPNEYDKLMSAIGASGTNAYTSNDMTVYVEDIPSNQTENWARIQADRFQNAVIRGFHTELETVYEEKNMSLTNDGRKAFEAMFTALYPDHPYGTQTVLGTQEQLKNPSIINIKNYYKQWYVPNNMAICLSGDFDPEQMIRIINQNFGSMKPNPNLPQLKLTDYQITSSIEKEILGVDAENVMMGWRFPGRKSKEYRMLKVIDMILCNGKAGLIDLNLNQQQKLLGGSSFVFDLSDYTNFMMSGRPKEGQSMEEVKNLLLGEIKNLKNGKFDERILESTINNFKLSEIYRLEYNSARTDLFIDAFINRIEWPEQISEIDEMAKITKKEVMEFAKKYFNDNYAVIYKKTGNDPNEQKISKPKITPIFMNRDTASIFLKEIQASNVTPIEPVFIDFEKDMSKLSFQNKIPVLYKQNKDNDVFQLIYIFDMGNNNDKKLGIAFTYMDYLGTSNLTPEQLKSEFYHLACSFNVYPGNDRTYVMLTGLNENLEKAVALFEELLADAQVNKEAYENLANDIIKSRADLKLNQNANSYFLSQYALYGAKSPSTNILSNEEYKQMNPQELIDRIYNLCSYKHRILYYGPDSSEQLLALLDKYHRTPKELKNIPDAVKFEPQITSSDKVLLAQYDANQIYMNLISNRGESFDPSLSAIQRAYNEYFGGGMNSIVFQEMREARGLAYSAWAGMNSPEKIDKPYMMTAFIASQNDKMGDAIHTFKEIIDNIPESESAFKIAKDNLINNMRTERITKSGILWQYISNEDFKLDNNHRKRVFDELNKTTLKDVLEYQKKWVKGRKYAYCILGDEKTLDLDKLSEYGPIQNVSQEELFGY